MFVIDVIPFSTNAPGTLSYRVRKKLALGTLVEVPLRKQQVLGVVIGISSVAAARAQLRTASYVLRAGATKPVGRIALALFAAAEETARYHAASLGSVLRQLLPDVIAESGRTELAHGEGFEERQCELPETERRKAYAALAREASERREGLLIIAPTVVEAARLADSLHDEGIDTVLLMGELRGKKRATALARAASVRGTVVVTPSFSFVPIKRLAGVVVERESASGYVAQKRPAIDFRIAARALARARRVPFIIGDYPLRLERRTPAEAALAPAKLGAISILDARSKPDEQKGAFKAVPEPMLQELRRTLEHGGRAAVLAVRKGYAPAVVCRDCGTAVADERGQTLALAGTASGKPILRSADGATLRDAKALCNVCGSWNLLPLGIGAERVALELTEALPGARIVRFDGDSVKTAAQARRASAEAMLSGTILVGTELVLPWIAEPLDYAGIASADALLAVPFWRARERFAHLALTLAGRAKRLTIASRRPDDTVFALLRKPSSTAFFDEELGLRKALGYPPYGTLITLAYEGAKERVAAASKEIAGALVERAATTLAPRALAKGRYRGVTVLKLPTGSWPDEELLARLRALPLYVRVRIDPESLW
jgi:primosomal protein N' (replication factor Y)